MSTAKEMLEAIAKETGYPRTQVRSILEAQAEYLAKELRNGSSVITPLGAFQIVELKARSGTNPKTGAPMNIPARNAIKFRAKKTLSSMVK
jgi:DNA-binding protein HU-beta